jgi:hypothetical protein
MKGTEQIFFLLSTLLLSLLITAPRAAVAAAPPRGVQQQARLLYWGVGISLAPQEDLQEEVDFLETQRYSECLST